MIILGLGANVGDRLQYLRRALQALHLIPHFYVEQISPVYISDALLPESAPKTWDMPYLNLAIRARTTLAPLELLHHVKQIETVIGRDQRLHWGPRPIDIDLLAWDDLIIYDDKLHIPHEQLHARPFVIFPLADVAPHWIYPLPNMHQGLTATEMADRLGSRFSGEAAFRTRQIMQRIDTPALVGIINITPDSFSDGGQMGNIDNVRQIAKTLVTEGASILDIGAEATGPKAKSITPTLEWQRLEPVLSELMVAKNNMLITPKISVDTRHAMVAEKALTLGVDWINDVSGLSCPHMRDIVKTVSADIVIMHHGQIPENNSHHLPLTTDPVKTVYDWACRQKELLAKENIDPARLIIDIGIGFGKTATQSLVLLQNIARFKNLDLRLLIGHSRKSFLRLFTDKSAADRDIETLSFSAYLAQLQIDYLRLHNIDYTARFLKAMKTCL